MVAGGAGEKRRIGELVRREEMERIIVEYSKLRCNGTAAVAEAVSAVG